MFVGLRWSAVASKKGGLLEALALHQGWDINGSKRGCLFYGAVFSFFYLMHFCLFKNLSFIRNIWQKKNVGECQLLDTKKGWAHKIWEFFFSSKFIRWFLYTSVFRDSKRKLNMNWRENAQNFSDKTVNVVITV